MSLLLAHMEAFELVIEIVGSCSSYVHTTCCDAAQQASRCKRQKPRRARHASLPKQACRVERPVRAAAQTGRQSPCNS